MSILVGTGDQLLEICGSSDGIAKVLARFVRAPTRVGFREHHDLLVDAPNHFHDVADWRCVLDPVGSAMAIQFSEISRRGSALGTWRAATPARCVSFLRTEPSLVACSEFSLRLGSLPAPR
jgi:hypothetical protein